MNKAVKPRNKFTTFVYRFTLFFTLAILGWANLLYINEGIRLPVYILFLIFLCGAFIFTLHYKHYCRRITAFLKTRFPNLNVDHALKICLIIAIVIGVPFRFGFAFIGKPYAPAEPLSDTGIHWEVSRELANNQPMQSDTAIYEAFFPHLIIYSATLSFFMRIIGQNVFAIIISNILFDAVSVLCIYFFLRSWKNTRTAIIGSVLWILSPINILYCGVGMPMVVTNTCILLTITLAYYIYKLYQQRDKRVYLLACLLGIIIAIGNSFRPIFTITIITILIIFLCYVFSRIKQGFKKMMPAVLIVGLIMVGSFTGGKLIDIGCQQINPYHVPGGTGVGWNFMLGANYESYGRWNRADSIQFGELVYGENTNPNLVEIQNTFFKEGINRYLAMNPIQLAKHFLHKTKVLFIDQDSSIAWPLGEAYNINTQKNIIYRSLHGMGVAMFAAMFCLSFIFIIHSIQSRKIDYVLFFLCLYFCGLVAASLLVEVMWRYILQPMVFIVIFAACNIGKFISNKKGEHHHESC